VLHAARWKYRMKNDAKKSPSGHHRTSFSATNVHIDYRKNVLSSNISSSTCPHNILNFGPLAAEIGPLVWGNPAIISTAFASWQRYCTVLKQWTSAKLCGPEQRAPPIFGRAAMTWGIGPHSSRDIIYHTPVYQQSRV